MTVQQVRLGLPPGWTALPDLADPSPEGWAARVADEVVPSGPEEHRRRLAAHLEEVAADSATRTPALAAALLDPPTGPVAVVVEVWVLVPDPGVPLEVERLVEQQRSSADLVLEPDVSTVELPAGPAVRVHRLLHGPEEPSLLAAVVEELTFLVLPAQTPGAGVVVTASWGDLARGEEFIAAVDDLVQGLGVRPVT